VTEATQLVTEGTVQQRILLIRGEKVIMDADLARFYGVSTKRLNEQVRRNAERFPADFMFQLTGAEKAEVGLRRTLASHREPAHKLSELERRLADHDQQILTIVQAIRELTSPTPVPPARRIGFRGERNDP
jgi:hypothetical protein